MTASGSRSFPLRNFGHSPIRGQGVRSGVRRGFEVPATSEWPEFPRLMRKTYIESSSRKAAPKRPAFVQKNFLSNGAVHKRPIDGGSTMTFGLALLAYRNARVSHVLFT